MATSPRTGEKAVAKKTAPAAKKAASPARPATKAKPATQAEPAKSAAGKAKKSAAGAAKTTVARKSAVPLTADQRCRYVEVAAYYIAERRGFQGGSALDDWAAAEAEVDRLLREGVLNA